MLRMTHQREIILEELKRSCTHPTADELYDVVRHRLPRVSLATVYRNLEQMFEAGLIRKVEFVGKQKRFDGDLNDHHHIICRRCGKVSDVHIDLRDGLEKVEIEGCVYSDVSLFFEFTGLCPECRDFVYDSESEDIANKD